MRLLVHVRGTELLTGGAGTGVLRGGLAGERHSTRCVRRHWQEAVLLPGCSEVDDADRQGAAVPA